MRPPLMIRAELVSRVKFPALWIRLQLRFHWRRNCGPRMIFEDSQACVRPFYILSKL